VNFAGIVHFAGGSYCFPINRNSLKIRLKAARGDLEKVLVAYGRRYTDYEKENKLIKEMEQVARDTQWDYFETTLTLNDPRFRYQFLLEDRDGEQYWFNEKGFFKDRPRGFTGGQFEYPYININEIFEIPEWVQDAVFYQIFPERFYNGNTSNDPENIQPWGAEPDRTSFFGGDLEGIIKKLDYLVDLGINALYLTPIFLSPSNHKYNIDDYYQVDPAFGEFETARLLVEEAHKRGIRVILDAVFNHCGFNFFAFKDVRQNGKKSRYVDWFDIEDFPVKTTPPVNYRTFANDVVSMPKLMTENPEVREYLLEVARYWIREIDADGWRLDVANEVDHHFWREFRQVVKSEKKDAYIVGEIWHDAQEWLRGDQFDAVMNYKFTYPVIDFFATRKIGPGTFDSLLARNRMAYKDAVNYAMLNLLDSHDTPRILHWFKGDKARMKLAVLFQMTYLGAPMVYYGDEVGMEGGDEPQSRRCMVWDENRQDMQLRKYYQRLINLRHELAPLRRGDYRTIVCDELTNIYGFIRRYQGEEVIVILNNSPHNHKIELDNRITKKAHLRNHLDNKTYEKIEEIFRIELAPFEGVILT
jgi:glycosidase